MSTYCLKLCKRFSSVSCICLVFVLYLSCICPVFVLYLSCICLVFVFYLSFICLLFVFYLSCICLVFVLYLSFIYIRYMMKQLAGLDEKSDEITCDTICECGTFISILVLILGSHCTLFTVNR